jgi:hypothetical protein
MASPAELVALLTDFGLQDTYVAQMKGVMLGINPKLGFVDVTHQVPRHDIEAGAFLLFTAYKAFPLGTIFLTVVDPGVGGQRRPLALSASGYYFVGPDNGIFTYVIHDAGTAGWRAWHLNRDRWWRKPVSGTFHGRDIFAPCAAWLSLGVPPSELGHPVSDPVLLSLQPPTYNPDGSAVGQVVHVDVFGNLTTNLRPPKYEVEVEIEELRLGGLRASYSEAEPGQPVALVGSAGLIEVAVREGDAAQALGLGVGARVVLRPRGKSKGA